MNIFVDPKTIAEEWDSYWCTSVLTEYDLVNDPKIKAFYERQQKDQEGKQKAAEERKRSRQRAGDNFLEDVSDE